MLPGTQTFATPRDRRFFFQPPRSTSALNSQTLSSFFAQALRVLPSGCQTFAFGSPLRQQTFLTSFVLLGGTAQFCNRGLPFRTGDCGFVVGFVMRMLRRREDRAGCSATDELTSTIAMDSVSQRRCTLRTHTRLCNPVART